MRIFLDANIFLYAAGAAHCLKPVCAQLLDRVAAGSLDAITSVEVIQEILHVYSRRGDSRVAAALGVRSAMLFPDLLSVHREDVLAACQLMQRYPGLSSRDAVHVASMLANGITRITSTDSDFDRVKEIQRIPPERV